MPVVIIVKTELQEDPFIWGPFTNEEQACGWASDNLTDLDWHWLPMERPGSIFLSCTVDDIVDFVETKFRSNEDSYVTVDDVNWVVSPKV